MKIGVVTIMDAGNYGNRLQNYAVCQLLKTRFGCQVMSLRPEKQKPFYDWHIKAWLKEHIAQVMCFAPELAEKRFGTGITRVANFRKWNKNIPTRVFYGQQDVPESVNNEYDLFLAGSDQIWNYHFPINRIRNVFLKFADASKRNSICASFGVEEIPEDRKQDYADALSEFAHISVREDAGAKIVKDLIGRDVPSLVDPVMMLSPEEWLRVSRKPRVDVSKPYVLKYYLGDSDQSKKIDKWAEKNGYAVYELLNPKFPEVYSAGPGEFISLIHNAALVCSDSFHCVVFSIIFARPFVVFSRQGESYSMTSRLDTVMGKFGLNRWDYNLTEDEYLTCDYSHREENLRREQDKFMQYLKEIIK